MIHPIPQRTLVRHDLLLKVSMTNLPLPGRNLPKLLPHLRRRRRSNLIRKGRRLNGVELLVGFHLAVGSPAEAGVVAVAVVVVEGAPIGGGGIVVKMALLIGHPRGVLVLLLLPLVPNHDRK